MCEAMQFVCSWKMEGVVSWKGPVLLAGGRASSHGESLAVRVVLARK